jgi:accessory gene regulator protein AgrB
MKLKHPCKYCIVRAACDKDCDRVYKYGEKIDSIIDAKAFLYGSIITSSLFIISIYFILCYFLSTWWLTTVPVLWTIEYVLLRYNEFDGVLGEDSILETIGSILMIIPATWIVLSIMIWEKYYDKYRPSMKGAT